MDKIRASAILCKLLCCSIDQLTPIALRKLVKKRFVAWHPDKNKEAPERFREEFQDLFKAWKVYNGEDTYPVSEEEYEPQPSTSQADATWTPDDLFCDETMSDCMSEDEDYYSGPFDDEFFTPSPTKKFAVPEDVREFFRSKTNRRAGKLFALFILESNYNFIEDFFKSYNLFLGVVQIFLGWKIRTNREIMCFVIEFNSDRRLVDIRKNARKFKLHPNEVFYAVKCLKFIAHLNEKYGEPICKLKSLNTDNEKKPDASSRFNHKLICDFAIRHEISDPLELMYEYAHLGQSCDRRGLELTKEHEEDHDIHTENAKIYIYASDRRKIAKNAIDTVFAQLYMQLKKERPQDYINRKCEQLGEILLETDDPEIFGLTDYYINHHFKLFEAYTKCIIESVLYGKPRTRWTILMGPYKCGKTSYANAILKFFEGVNINVNIDKGRLPFYLGQAIGRRFVLMDDVKGKIPAVEDTLLMSGCGFHNLDDLRDFLDGHVEVQLEKKNQQPISQIFPPGIITCNEYEIPSSIKERINGPLR